MATTARTVRFPSVRRSLTAALICTALLTGLIAGTGAPAGAVTGYRTIPGLGRYAHAIPATTGQVIVVKNASWRSSHATVDTWRRRNGRWVRVFAPMPARVGARGIQVGRKQGSLRTPAGLFGLRYAFGPGRDPGTGMRWRRFDRNDYWGYDPHDAPTYNTYQTSRRPGARVRLSWAEHPC